MRVGTSCTGINSTSSSPTGNYILHLSHSQPNYWRLAKAEHKLSKCSCATCTCHPRMFGTFFVFINAALFAIHNAHTHIRIPFPLFYSPSHERTIKWMLYWYTSSQCLIILLPPMENVLLWSASLCIHCPPIHKQYPWEPDHYQASHLRWYSCIEYITCRTMALVQCYWLRVPPTMMRKNTMSNTSM